MPLLWISLSFLAGIVIAAALPLPAWAWTLIALAFFILYIFLRRSQLAARFSFLNTFPFIPLLPIFFFLGSAYYQARQPNTDAFHLIFYNDRSYDLLITGYIEDAPDYRDTYTNLTLPVSNTDIMPCLIRQILTYSGLSKLMFHHSSISENGDGGSGLGLGLISCGSFGL